MNFQNTVFKSKYIAFTAAFGVVVLGNLSANALNGDPLYKWLDPTGDYHILTSIVTILLLILSMYVLYMHRLEFQSIRMITENKSADFNVGIILLLSPPFGAIFNNGKIEIPKKDGGSLTIPNVTNSTSSESMKEDIELLQETKFQWSWQQILRGVCHHYNSAKYIYIIGSDDTYKTEIINGITEKVKDKDGSFMYLDNAKSLLLAYKKDLVIETHETSVNFENFNALRSALATSIRWMRTTDELKREVVNDKDMVIDITGGQKTASITGAMVTLDNNLTFQYVQTGGDNKVISFDVISQAPASAM